MNDETGKKEIDVKFKISDIQYKMVEKYYNIIDFKYKSVQDLFKSIFLTGLVQKNLETIKKYRDTEEEN
jgi:hypothetical protein